MTTSLDSTALLRNTLDVFSHHMRECWRLQNSAPNQKTLLPEHMRATPESTLASLRSFVEHDENNFEHGVQAWLEQASKDVQAEFGPLSDWVAEDVTTSLPLDWKGLMGYVISGVQAAHRSIEQGAPDMSIDWEHVGRACVSLGFALRAVVSIKQAQDKEILPAGVRLSKNFSKGPFLCVRVLDDQGLVLAEADNSRTAIDLASVAYLSRREPHELTPWEFERITTVVRVDEGRGKSGSAKTGSKRLLFVDQDSQSDLRHFLNCAKAHATQDAGHEGELSDSWVDNSMKTIMASSFDGPLKSLNLKGGGHLLLSRWNAVNSDTLHVIHRHYVQDAIAQGKAVPKRVIDVTSGLDMNEVQDASTDASRPRQQA